MAYTAGSDGVNSALSACVPTARAVVDKVAVPADTATGVPSWAAPSRKRTEPAASAGATVAVSFTAVPWTAEVTGAVARVVVVAAAGAALW